VTTPSARVELVVRQRRFYGILCLLLTVLYVLPGVGSHEQLFAQKQKNDYAVIVGTVWGPDDRPVYGVPVKIRRGKDKPNKVRWEVMSDHHGEFEQRVPVGEMDYILTADLKGFKTADGKQLRLVHDITVHIYHDEREDTGLHLTF
jgi:hypothetical protein